MPRVLNARHVGKNRKGARYCGRPSLFGNPFEIGRDGTRDEVIQKFINHLHDTPALVEKARQELAGMDLICWCAPAKCHCDVLITIANGGQLPPKIEVRDLFGSK